MRTSLAASAGTVGLRTIDQLPNSSTQTGAKQTKVSLGQKRFSLTIQELQFYSHSPSSSSAITAASREGHEDRIQGAA
jgi:hypothetical protein